MKSITLILFSLFFFTNLCAQEYCKAEGSRGTGDRVFSEFKITGATTESGSDDFLSTFTLANNRSLYHDRTSEIIEVTQGDQLTLTIKHTSIWMYFYAYIDFDKNRTFNTDNELSLSLAPTTTGGLPAEMPVITIPEDAPIGTTRFRFKSEWDSTDPCGDAISMSGNRGIMIDYTIKINPRKTISTVTVENVEHGTIALSTDGGNLNSGTEVAIGTEVTVKATPDAGYKLHQILVNDVVLNTSSFTVGTKDIVITADFIPENSNILTIAPAVNGSASAVVLGEAGIETPVNSGEYVMNGSSIKVTFTPAEKYLLKAVTLNESNITEKLVDNAHTFTMNEATYINATFKNDPLFLTYCIPTETANTTDLTSAFVELITTTGGINNLNQLNTSRTFYTDMGEISVVESKKITLNLQAKSLGDYSTTEPKQDLRFTVAALFIDWDQDGDFSSAESERIAGKLSNEGIHTVGGNMDVLNITKEITVPLGVLGKIKARVVYNNAWMGNPLTKACGPIKEGVVYDFVMDVKVAIYPVSIVQPSPEAGSFKVMNGDTEVNDGEEILVGTVLTVVPNLSSNEYEVRSVLLNGKPIEGYEITVQDATEISLDIIKGRSVSYSITGEGALSITDAKGVTIENNGVVSKGSTIIIKAAPSKGYHIVSVMVDGEDKTTECSSAKGLTFIVNKSIQIEAVFAINTYKLDYTFNQELGRVTVLDGVTEVESGSMITHGKVLTVTVNPLNDQCYINEVKLDGKNVKDELLPDNKRTFDLIIDKPTSLEVLFAAQTYELTYNTPQYGTIEVKDKNGTTIANNSKITVNSMLYVTLTARNNELLKLLINDGIEELDYVEEGYVDQDGDTYTTDLTVAGNVNIVATFSPSVGIKDATSTAVLVYMDNSDNVVIDGAKIGSNVKIYSITGLLISETTVTNSKESIHMSESCDIYLVRITDEVSSIVKKLIKK